MSDNANISSAQLKAIQSLWGLYARHSLDAGDADPRVCALELGFVDYRPHHRQFQRTARRRSSGVDRQAKGGARPADKNLAPAARSRSGARCGPRWAPRRSRRGSHSCFAWGFRSYRWSAGFDRYVRRGFYGLAQVSTFAGAWRDYPHARRRKSRRLGPEKYGAPAAPRRVKT